MSTRRLSDIELKGLDDIRKRRQKADADAMQLRFDEQCTWRDVDILLRRIDEVEARASEWRPIETVPRDGTEILLAHDMEGLIWTDEWMSEWAADGKKGCWRTHEAWQKGLIGGPTHWMPLPEPPEQPST